ncbi:MAG: 50S ribosomal protein L30 [Candidatus Cloacimonetes bacterium]|nr:50S ribosomal protein L30 [Candidatus Cloacimonadota bacterium]
MKLKVTQIRSIIGHRKNQRDTIKALGLGKINRSRIHDDNPVIRGMINNVFHLVKFELIKEEIRPLLEKKPKAEAKPVLETGIKKDVKQVDAETTGQGKTITPRTPKSQAKSVKPATASKKAAEKPQTTARKTTTAATKKKETVKTGTAGKSSDKKKKIPVKTGTKSVTVEKKVTRTARKVTKDNAEPTQGEENATS